MERKELKDVEEGDRVWVGTSSNPHHEIRRVAALTPKLMKLDGDPDRFRRDNGKPAVGSRYTTRRVTKVATPEECDKWDAEVTERKRLHAEREEVRRRFEAAREELYALLPKCASITETPRVEGEEWEITLRLSEEGVRRLAAWLANGSPL